jgi:phosphomannomutase
MSKLMFSVSGIRGVVGETLIPEIIVNYTNAYADLIKEGNVIVGRDSRISGEMVKHLVIGTLLAKGINVTDIGIVPTPTVQFTVKNLSAQGGIAISASHNPNEWNALKLLNSKGEFLSKDENSTLKTYLNYEKEFKNWNQLGKYQEYYEAIDKHIENILKLDLINVEKIQKRKFKVLLDCVNGAGVYSATKLLQILNCEIIEYNCDKTGIFPRLPEPLPENIVDTMTMVKESNVDLGLVVDPDVDRLVIITDKGEPFGEENTITQCVNFVLSKLKGNVVINLSTTRAVEDVAKKFDCKVFRTPVGEANVVEKMKQVNAIIGGEGSGGVILPELHYGRDALVGIALTLQNLVENNISISELKTSLPDYYISKRKIELAISPDEIISKLIEKYSNENINTEDGLRIDFDNYWVHLRKSNTEPIIRIIVEADSQENADKLSLKFLDEIKSLI